MRPRAGASSLPKRCSTPALLLFLVLLSRLEGARAVKLEDGQRHKRCTTNCGAKGFEQSAIRHLGPDECAECRSPTSRSPCHAPFAEVIFPQGEEHDTPERGSLAEAATSAVDAKQCCRVHRCSSEEQQIEEAAPEHRTEISTALGENDNTEANHAAEDVERVGERDAPARRSEGRAGEEERVDSFFHFLYKIFYLPYIDPVAQFFYFIFSSTLRLLLGILNIPVETAELIVLLVFAIVGAFAGLFQDYVLLNTYFYVLVVSYLLVTRFLGRLLGLEVLSVDRLRRRFEAWPPPNLELEDLAAEDFASLILPPSAIRWDYEEKLASFIQHEMARRAQQREEKQLEAAAREEKQTEAGVAEMPTTTPTSSPQKTNVKVSSESSIEGVSPEKGPDEGGGDEINKTEQKPPGPAGDGPVQVVDGSQVDGTEVTSTERTASGVLTTAGEKDQNSSRKRRMQALSVNLEGARVNLNRTANLAATRIRKEYEKSVLPRQLHPAVLIPYSYVGSSGRGSEEGRGAGGGCGDHDGTNAGAGGEEVLAEVEGLFSSSRTTRVISTSSESRRRTISNTSSVVSSASPAATRRRRKPAQVVMNPEVVETTSLDVEVEEHMQSPLQAPAIPPDSSDNLPPLSGLQSAHSGADDHSDDENDSESRDDDDVLEQSTVSRVEDFSPSVSPMKYNMPKSLSAMDLRYKDYAHRFETVARLSSDGERESVLEDTTRRAPTTSPKSALRVSSSGDLLISEDERERATRWTSSSSRHFHQNSGGGLKHQLEGAPTSSRSKTGGLSSTKRTVSPRTGSPFSTLGTTPVLAFVNPRSGGQDGYETLRKLKSILHPIQVVNLKEKNALYEPVHLLEWFCTTFGSRLRVLVAGGDGTVDWVLSMIDSIVDRDDPSVSPTVVNAKGEILEPEAAGDRPLSPAVAAGSTSKSEGLKTRETIVPPPVGILPLGTGNDLARVFGWSRTSNIRGFLSEFATARAVFLDRWVVSSYVKRPIEQTQADPAEHSRGDALILDEDGTTSIKGLSRKTSKSKSTKSAADRDLVGVGVDRAKSAADRDLVGVSVDPDDALADLQVVDETTAWVAKLGGLVFSILVKAQTLAQTIQETFFRKRENNVSVEEESNEQHQGQGTSKSDTSFQYQLVRRKTASNYVGIGVDGTVITNFHDFREELPGLFILQKVNKFYYALMGLMETILRSCSDLPNRVKIRCDGREYALQDGIEGIIMSNITSYAGGARLWQGPAYTAPLLLSQEDAANGNGSAGGGEEDSSVGVDDALEQRNSSQHGEAVFPFPVDGPYHGNTSSTGMSSRTTAARGAAAPRRRASHGDVNAGAAVSAAPSLVVSSSSRNNENQNIFSEGTSSLRRRRSREPHHRDQTSSTIASSAAVAGTTQNGIVSAAQEQVKSTEDYPTSSLDAETSSHDNLLDVVMLRGADHLALIMIGMDRAIRLCQAREIEIEINSTKPIPIQLDGEPWSQPGISKVKVELKHPRSQAVMLKRIEHGLGERAFVKTLSNGTERGIILPWQRDALLKEMAAIMHHEERQPANNNYYQRTTAYKAYRQLMQYYGSS
ncbi:unnamed protein product [Amoebophrya sp. A25]|nr:unnamed protein product [Amoebophrya sp. A25]|eukprot:GSA25T00024596001.1